jgi:ABC-type glycerol-3-phosphate transport system permease component
MIDSTGRAQPTPALSPALALPRLAWRKVWRDGLRYVVLFAFSFILLLPFVWLLSASLKTEGDYFAVPTRWIPTTLVWSNYERVLTEYNLPLYIFNSLWLAVFSVVVNVFVSSLVAYGFARFRFRGREVLFLVLLATMMLPSQISTIALYRVFRGLGWIGTFLPILVPRLFGSAFDIFLFRQYFLSLPREIDEAAKLDGCSTWGIYRRIILPQSKPILVVVAITTFLFSWRDLWGPLIYLSDEGTRTLPLGLLLFTVPGRGTLFPLLMAATVIALIPPIVLYLFGQRYFDRGIVVAEVR